MPRKRKPNPTIQALHAALVEHSDDLPELLRQVAELGIDTDSLSIHEDKQGPPIEVWPEEDEL